MSAAGPPPAAPSLDPFPPGELLWEGRPALGPRLPDLLAAVSAFAPAFVVLTPGFHLMRGLPLAEAARLAALFAGVVGLVTFLARALGAGGRLTLSASFAGAFFAGAVHLGDGRVGPLLCPATLVGVVGALLTLRFRQRLATRYRLTATRAAVGEEGRYVITFSLQRPPVVVPDRFGAGLGELDFGVLGGTLTTRDGRVFTVPPQPRRFHRVRAPQRLRELLTAVGGPPPP